MTDANGNARVTFTMPDALTRWRITGRAMDSQGRVGQRTAYLRSDKSFYAKWTAPDWMRAGDAPRASVAVFNQTGAEQALEVTLSGGAAGAQAKTEKLAAKPGVNYVEFALASGAAGPLRLEVKQNGKLVDALDTTVQTLPAAWSSPRTLMLPLGSSAEELALKLPADARNIRLSFAQGAASQFSRIADDLIDYPYGCVEQTASRLIPLALATQSLGPDASALRERLQATLTAQRLRLVSMAGPNAVFGWWGNATAGNALMTAYAYYADWYAARALRIELPPEHWNRLLAVYSEHGLKASLTDRALVLWMAHDMGLPTRTLAAGLVDDHAGATLAGKAHQAGDSLLLGAPDDRESQAMALGLLAVVAGQNQVAVPAALQQQIASAWTVLREAKAPVAQALLMLAGEAPPSQADTVLAGVRADMPTLDRAMTLLWVQKKLGGPAFGKAPAMSPDGTWLKQESRSGQPVWRWPEGKGVPATLRLAAGVAAPADTVAVLQYESRAAEAQSLPVTVERRILKMVQGKAGYTTELVKSGEALSTDALYLDEITLKAAPGAKHRFGLLEVALPPGAMVEATTWGMTMAGDKPVALERARHTERRDGYAVPIEPLEGEVTVRHLLRFAQKGSYVLPPARFHRMYQPEQKAFEGGGKGMRALKVE